MALNTFKCNHLVPLHFRGLNNIVCRQTNTTPDVLKFYPSTRHNLLVRGAPGSTLAGGHNPLTSSACEASHNHQALSWRRRCHERPTLIGADCLMECDPRGGSAENVHRRGDVTAQHDENPSAEERPRDSNSFRIPRGLHDPQGLYSFSESLQMDIRPRESSHSSSQSYEHSEGPTTPRGLNSPRRFHDSRGMCDQQPLNDDPQNHRLRHPQRLCDPRGLSNPHAVPDPQGVHRPQRICNSHAFCDPPTLRGDPHEFSRWSESDSGRLRIGRRLSGRSDDLYRPYSNLASTGSTDVADVTSKDHPEGRVTSMSVGSVDSAHRRLVKFLSLPNVAEIERQASTGSDVTEPWHSVFESRCLDHPSTFVSMPCISSHHRRRGGTGRGLTPKRFLPTLSISKEVSTATSTCWSLLSSRQ